MSNQMSGSRSRGDIRTDAAQEVPTWAEMAYRGNSRNHEFDGRSTDKDADQQNRGRRNDHVRVLGTIGSSPTVPASASVGRNLQQLQRPGLSRVAPQVAGGTWGRSRRPRVEHRPGQLSARRRRNSTGSADLFPNEQDQNSFRRALSRDISYERQWAPKGVDLREAIQAESIIMVEAALAGNDFRQKLMAKNAEKGAGMLMLAVSIGNVPIFLRLADIIVKRLGPKLLAKQLRYEDDDKQPLIFYAAASSLEMFRVVKELLRDTIGIAGLAEQLRRRCVAGRNALMRVSSNTGVILEMRKLLGRTECLKRVERVRGIIRRNCLDELMEADDRDGKSWFLHAAAASNLDVLVKIRLPNMYAICCASDRKGWNAFTHAARGQGERGSEFFAKLCDTLLDGDDNADRRKNQMVRVANDDDQSTLLMHAAVGGSENFRRVCLMMRKDDLAPSFAECDRDATLLSWAAEGGDAVVISTVAAKIKEEKNDILDVGKYQTWYKVNDQAEAGVALLKAVTRSAKRRAGTSLFTSAIRSGRPTVIRSIAKGYEALQSDAKECWKIMCGRRGNPLVVAASQSVASFRETVLALQAVISRDTTGETNRQLLDLIKPETGNTPLCSAVLSEKPSMFDEVLRQANFMARKVGGPVLSGSMIIEQVRDALINEDEQMNGPMPARWISAKMLGKVSQAARRASKDGSITTSFGDAMLKSLLEMAVEYRAFDHVRTLLRNGYHVSGHFSALLSKIDIDEENVHECIILAITTASNPFVEGGIASQAIYEATFRQPTNHAAFSRLRQQITALMLQLFEHLPHSVTGVGKELSRGDDEHDPLWTTESGRRTALLGFVAVKWMLEGTGAHAAPSSSRVKGGGNPLVQAVRAGSRALDLLSEALVLDYLGVKFRRTLPLWNTQRPIYEGVSTAFHSYSYRQQTRETDSASGATLEGDPFEALLCFLQGQPSKGELPTLHAILPGLQFTLAGIIGRPVSYYVVPAVRLAFVVVNYLTMLGLYFSCVSLKSNEVPATEWMFYVFTLGSAWREKVEFASASKAEPGWTSALDSYFSDKWNFLDVTTVVFVFIAFVFRIVELESGNAYSLFVAQLFLATAAPLLLSRVLFLTQIGSPLGPMTQVIFTMMKELGQFSLILFLVMFGFAATFNALYGNNTVLVEQLFGSDVCDVKNHPVVGMFGTLSKSLRVMFEAMLGAFDLDVFYVSYGRSSAEGGECGGVSYPEAGVTLMVVYLIIMTIMLLNLLIAVLSTAHSEVQENAPKQFQLERAKVIVQSADDVAQDILPPPFNLLSLFLGIIWPVRTTGADARERCSDSNRWRDTIVGTIHRMIFAIFVGLGALAASLVLWAVSAPKVAFQLSLWMSKKFGCEQGQRSQGSLDSRRGSLTKENGQRRFSQEEDSVEEVFFSRSDEQKGGASIKNITSIVEQLLCVAGGVFMAAILYVAVFPLLFLLLWARGMFDVAQYGAQMRSKRSFAERRQLDSGEDDEWWEMRNWVIQKNQHYKTVNSMNNVFNVGTMLNTTTGMTMEDLRQNMDGQKDVDRAWVLEASLDNDIRAPSG